MNIEIEKCSICSCDVVFESYGGSPREYDVCVSCEDHICPACIGGYDKDDNSICKLCKQSEDND